MPKSNTNENNQPTTSSANLPPKLPGTAEALQRAILLLGNRTKSQLGDKSRGELENLIGAYPTSSECDRTPLAYRLRSVALSQNNVMKTKKLAFFPIEDLS